MEIATIKGPQKWNFLRPLVIPMVINREKTVGSRYNDLIGMQRNYHYNEIITKMR